MSLKIDMKSIILIFTLWFGLSGSVMGSIVPPHFFTTIDKTINVMQEEIWKDVISYEGLYQVSNLGRVKSLKRNRVKKDRILKPQSNTDNYLMITLCSDRNRITRTIHQLVCESFLNHTPNGNTLVVNHKNFIRTDNRLDNLEIVSMRENGSKKQIKSSSKYVGVSWNKALNKWQSYVDINGKRIHIGYFQIEYDAHLAYKNKLQLND